MKAADPTRAITANAPFSIGNAIVDGRRGWFIGHFFAPESGLRHQSELEVKWGQHRRGERRAGFSKSRCGATIAVLVSGSFRVEMKLDDRREKIHLRNAGDYLVIGPEVPHSWEALEDSLVISIRFPSVPASQVELP